MEGEEGQEAAAQENSEYNEKEKEYLSSSGRWRSREGGGNSGREGREGSVYSGNSRSRSRSRSSSVLPEVPAGIKRMTIGECV